LGPLAPSPAWTLVTPYFKRTRPGRGTNTKAAGFPPLSRRSLAASLSPLRARPRARPIWAGARGDTHSSAQGPPGLETPTILQRSHRISPNIGTTQTKDQGALSSFGLLPVLILTLVLLPVTLFTFLSLVLSFMTYTT
jgi:hypothetical protein